MEALIYISTATTLPNQRIVDEILVSARRNNPAMGLTGMLLWSDMTFAQLLEGPPDSLDVMYARLIADPRHHDVRLLSRWPTDRRLFAEWSMASRRLAPRQPWALLDAGRGEAVETANWVLFLMNELRRPATAA